MSTPNPGPRLEPSSNRLNVAEGQTFEEDLTAYLSANGTIPKIDIYFLTDATGSMNAAIKQVSSRAGEILQRLTDKARDIGILEGLRFGVGNYTDFDVHRGEHGFTHQQSLTADFDQVKSALNAWTNTANNETTAEQALYALDRLAVPPNTDEIQWRDRAKRVVIWMGDAPSHDPISTDRSGLDHEITTRSVVDKLQRENLFLIALSIDTGGSSSPGLDTNPNDHGNYGDHDRATEHQITEIFKTVRGSHENGIPVDDVVRKIIDYGTEEIEKIKDVKLRSDSTRYFLEGYPQNVDPVGNPGDLPGGHDHQVDFRLSFRGLARGAADQPSRTEPKQLETGLTLLTDGVAADRKDVTIELSDLSGRYKFVSWAHDTVAEIDPSWDHDGGQVKQGSSKTADDAHQVWELIPANRGYLIRNVGQDRYMEVHQASDDQGAELHVLRDPEGDHKHWRVLPVGADSHGHLLYRIENVKSRKVVDVWEADRTPGAVIRQADYWIQDTGHPENHRQHWWLERVY